MDAIRELAGIDFPSLFLSVFTILIGLKACQSVLEWFTGKLGLETKWMRKRKEDHELLMNTAKSLTALQEMHKKDMEASDRHDEELCREIKQLTAMFIDKEIDDMRWEINSFATKVSEGRPCNKDSYTHCIRIYEKYEKLLEENGLENGEVEVSMELINESYKQKRKEGVF